MLVKLGNSWVNPERISFLEPAINRDNIGNSLAEVISIVTMDGSTRTAGNIDEFASIVNNALGQSYGGENEVSKEE